jgi:hypothetical protein
MTMHHRIIIEPTTLGRRGQRYRTTYAGSVLVESSCNPEFDACRALMARGITGKLQVWRSCATFPAMTLDIERAARLTVSETDKDGLRVVSWRPFSAELAPDVVLSRAVGARKGESEVAATLALADTIACP